MLLKNSGKDMAQQESKPNAPFKRIRASTGYVDPFKTGNRDEYYSVMSKEALDIPFASDGGTRRWVNENLYKIRPAYTKGFHRTLLPTIDWKQLYNQEQWPGLHNLNVDLGPYTELNYGPSDYDRIQTYIDEGMPGVNRYDFMQYQRQHPITQIPINIQPVERPPILPIDAALAGYTPISQLPKVRKVRKSGNEQQYERASGHIKQLRRPK
jgi:hypothetical protein